MPANLIPHTQYEDLKHFLDLKSDQYNNPRFIENDPIVIPHQFTKKQDIEIMGFWAAMLAWGQRKTIINKCRELIRLMDGAPYDFIINHQDGDLKRFLGFKHRTFNDTDTLYFLEFFRQHYRKSDTLETAFVADSLKSSKPFNFLPDFVIKAGAQGDSHRLKVEIALNYFRSYFFSLPDFPRRTIKHVSSPAQKSGCKRLNMFLRWMVRCDSKGVDFGIWKSLQPADLICPTDVHVDRVARKLGLITRTQVNWKTATELTERLREFDPADPVKYDFALFGLGIEEGW
ncbi:MAG TPA: TIGR02757 family protein [Sphingobacteriaceae bacterium]|nr:TIGR02757 family protein [Sphingobacteriaceae bacterium]